MKFSCVLFFLLSWGLSAAFLYSQYQEEQQERLAENNTVLATTYRASVEMFRLATDTLVSDLIRHTEILDTFAAGVRGSGASRDRARGKLYRQLAPAYDHLKQRGIHQLHFHAADGHSFLRFHAPDRYGDPLFDLRPSIRLANTERRPVVGFEAGRLISGFRYVYPLFRDGEHLGSVETSVTFRAISEAMAAIDPGREYLLVLRKAAVDRALFDEQRTLYGNAPLHDAFLVEDPLLRLPGSPPPLTATVQQLNAQLADRPRVRLGMTSGRPFSEAVAGATGDWAIAFLPIADLLGENVAYVISYTPAPYLIALRHEFLLNLGLSALALGSLSLLACRLLNSYAAVRQEKQRLQTVTDTIAEGLYVMDLQGRIVQINPAFTDILGYRADEIVGRIGHELFHVHGDGNTILPLDQCPIYTTTINQMSYVGEELFRHQNGQVLNVEISCKPIIKEARLEGSVTAFRDITQRKAADERIRFLAQYDPLTALPNRALLLDRLQQAIAGAERDGEKLAVLFLDLDHFKIINDSLGHTVGDQLLQQTASRLSECVRGSDSVSRPGGDEFILVLLQVRETSAPAHLAQKILEIIAEPYRIDGQQLHLSVSIGIALYPDDGRDTATLIKNADAAMYHAKQNGRNNYQFFTAELNARARERLTLENSLRLALERREFLLYYQPLVDLTSGRIIGAEALLRWQHPERGLVPPDQFIPVAEECGMILPLGEWVIQEACRQNLAWQQLGLPPVPVAVNISPRQFLQQNLGEVIQRALDETGLAPRFLEIEITENLLMAAEHKTLAILRSFKEMGLRVAIDDFGTGYSSLSYLKTFPIDKVKIDRSFVRDVSSDPNDAAIVSAIIAMAHRLHLGVIAEGVEALDQRAFLEQEGCNEAQGYYYSRPLPAGEMAQLLREVTVLPREAP